MKMRSILPVLVVLLGFAGSALAQQRLPKCDPALNRAVQKDDLKKVRKLVAEGSAVANCVYNTGFHTPLMDAALGNHEMVELLIELGADVNVRNERGETALSGGTTRNVAVAKALVEAGADVNAQDKRGETLLHSTAYGGCLNGAVEMAKYLLSKGASLKLKNFKGQTPIDRSFERESQPCQKGMIQLLREHSAAQN